MLGDKACVNVLLCDFIIFNDVHIKTASVSLNQGLWEGKGLVVGINDLYDLAKNVGAERIFMSEVGADGEVVVGNC